MKKTIFVLFVLLAAALLFTGCQPEDAGNTPADPTPESYDGTWICELEIPVGRYMGLDFDNAVIGTYAKVIISGNNYTMYRVSDAYLAALSYWSCNPTTQKPADDWLLTQEYDHGTIAVNGNEVTITSIPNPSVSGTGTLSSDKKSFTWTIAHPLTTFPVTATFKKQ